MGVAGRIACIFTPMALTIASFVCLVLLEVAGWNAGTLGQYYFLKTDFTSLRVSSATQIDNSTTLTNALEYAKNHNLLKQNYQIYLWDYCYSDNANGTLTGCSARQSEFYFDFVDLWGLNNTAAANAPDGTASPDNSFQSHENGLKNNTEELESELLGDSGKKAYDAYREVSKWMFVGFQVALWSTLATIVLGIFAMFSRWGSFFTWILAFISSAFGVASAATASVLFAALAGSLRELLDPYQVHISLGGHAFAIMWLSVVFSWAATLFWLFSICCCSGRSNPHHRSNKGGLWAAEPKGQGYGDFGAGRGRGLRVEKTGGGYERVASPFLGHAENEHGDRVPLNDYRGPSPNRAPEASSSYEPFRHT